MTAEHSAVAPALQAMLEARTVAVVGASAQPGSFGAELLRQLRVGGFDGTVYPVNPRYSEIDGVACAASIGELPEPVDLAILGVGDAILEETLRTAGEAGARSAVICASGHAIEGAPGLPLPERLQAIAREYGMAVCGGNGMGFINMEHRLRATGYSQDANLLPGRVTFLTQSGSSFSALLRNRRGIRFNLAVSGGDELVTTMAEYLEYSLALASTRVIAVFMETIRAPERFRRALEVAAARDVPVVALKVGQGELARRMVTAHSGAIAGEDAAYEALFERTGVLRVRGLDELADTVELLCAGRAATAGGLASLHDSGGERTHLIDVAAACGVPLAVIGDSTKEHLAQVLGPGLPPVNPLDAWDTSGTAHDVFTSCLQALHDDPDTAAVAFAVDLVADEREDVYPAIALSTAAVTTKPFALLCNLRSAIDPDKARALRDAGIPVLEGTETGVRAIGHLLSRRDFKIRGLVDLPEPRIDAHRAEQWRARITAGPLAEAGAMDLLTAYGIPAVRCLEVDGLDRALDAAVKIGWPVVLKTAAPGVAHKTERDGVRLGLVDESALRHAYADIESRLGARMTVAAMVAHTPGAIEFHLGIVVDEQFGPLVVVAAGGVLVEAFDDRAVVMPPLSVDRALAALDSVRVSRVLDGVRGRPPVDRREVAGAISALSQLALELGDVLEAVDINPLIAGPHGCIAADALVVPRPLTTT
ncbi:MAG: acetate--CoA ligase family protein [Candidatus Dormibacteria bacterium]